MSLHGKLRAATANAHAALEQELDWEARLATRDGYRGLLARLHGFHAVWEPAIAAGLKDDAFLAPRLRLLHLETDLRHLGLSPATIAALPQAGPIALHSRPEALGALYVLEGSTLGGQIILRHVARLHGIAADTGGAYYGGRGRAAGPLWAAFRTELDQLTGDAEAELAAQDAAIATFEAMRLWLVATDGRQRGAQPRPA